MRAEYDKNIHAELVYDGMFHPRIPTAMGAPNPDQLSGTPLENLCELAGRICYDSLGAKGSRPTASYHQHIKDVQHYSVYAHANLTIKLLTWDDRRMQALASLVGRPGVRAEVDENGALRVTFNLRAAVEWQRWSDSNASLVRWTGDPLNRPVRRIASMVAPLIVPSDGETEGEWSLVEPESDHECWISLYLAGSRGLSHEQVRHHWEAAVSQRSTRYCDEDGSPQVEHPLITEYLRDMNARCCTDGAMAAAAGVAMRRWEAAPGVIPHHTRLAYRNAVTDLQDWLLSRGVDKHAARKQARGAARGFLPNSLHTEMIFSASVAQWRFMLQQRCSVHADAEIRVLYAPVFRALLQSRYAARFADMALVPSPDGIGEVITTFNTTHT